MFEKVLNTTAGWIEGLSYPQEGVKLDDVKYQWYITQSKVIYPHASKKDGSQYSVLRVTNKSIGKVGIYDFPIRETELLSLLQFYAGDKNGTKKIGTADNLLIRAFGIRSEEDVYPMTTFDLPLAKQNFMAFRIESGSENKFGIRSTTISLKGVDIQYAFFTNQDLSIIGDMLSEK